MEEFNDGLEDLEEVILSIFELGTEGGEIFYGLLGEAVGDVGMSSNVYKLV